MEITTFYVNIIIIDVIITWGFWWTILDFSKRYWSTLAPSIVPCLLKYISIYFPNREELSFLTVLAFPNAEIRDIYSFILSNKFGSRHFFFWWKSFSDIKYFFQINLCVISIKLVALWRYKEYYMNIKF